MNSLCPLSRSLRAAIAFSLSPRTRLAKQGRQAELTTQFAVWIMCKYRAKQIIVKGLAKQIYQGLDHMFRSDINNILSANLLLCQMKRRRDEGQWQEKREGRD